MMASRPSRPPSRSSTASTAATSRAWSLEVFAEDPVLGREANAAAWRGYIEAFPRYVIYPRRIAGAANRVAILGHTTGSHLGLPDAEERERTLIWIAHVLDGAIELWRLIEDSPDNRRRLGLDV